MKHIYLIPIMMLAVLCGACHKEKKSAEGPRDIDVALPQTDSVVTHRTFPGIVRSTGSVQVMARVSGTLMQKCFKEGDYVTKGQVLYRIESTQYENAVREAEAALETARSKVGYYSHQTGAMERAYREDAVAEMNVIQSQSNLRQSQAAVQNAEATLSDARTQLSYCTVRAPISGQISSSKLDVGSVVSGAGNPTPLCEIVNNGSLKVQFSIDDAEYQHLMTLGLGNGGPLFRDVPLKFGDDVKGMYTTDLYYVSPSIDSTTGQIVLEGAVNDPTHVLRDGMYVSVDLPTGVIPHATVVKDASIGTDERGQYIYTVNDSNQIVYTSVETGDLFRDSLRVILKGVNPKTRYVTKALLTVRPGMTIRPHLTD